MTPPELQVGDALFLDFDGTLVEIAEHPERVLLPIELPALLAAVRERLDGALALVSGRRLDDVDRMLAPLRFAGAGLHGLELRHRPELAIESTSTIDLSAAASAASATLAHLPGVWLEDKGAALAIHFRAVPETMPECVALASDLASRFGLQVTQGKMVVEIRAPGADKGTALELLMGAPPFQSRRPVFIGDDVTDEDGFAAAARLGGFGIRIGPGSSAAKFRLPDVKAALAYLVHIAAEANS